MESGSAVGCECTLLPLSCLRTGSLRVCLLLLYCEQNDRSRSHLKERPKIRRNAILSVEQKQKDIAFEGIRTPAGKAHEKTLR